MIWTVKGLHILIVQIQIQIDIFFVAYNRKKHGFIGGYGNIIEYCGLDGFLAVIRRYRYAIIACDRRVYDMA